MICWNPYCDAHGGRRRWIGRQDAHDACATVDGPSGSSGVFPVHLMLVTTSTRPGTPCSTCRSGTATTLATAASVRPRWAARRPAAPTRCARTVTRGGSGAARHPRTGSEESLKGRAPGAGNHGTVGHGGSDGRCTAGERFRPVRRNPHRRRVGVRWSQRRQSGRTAK